MQRHDNFLEQLLYNDFQCKQPAIVQARPEFVQDFREQFQQVDATKDDGRSQELSDKKWRLFRRKYHVR